MLCAIIAITILKINIKNSQNTIYLIDLDVEAVIKFILAENLKPSQIFLTMNISEKTSRMI